MPAESHASGPGAHADPQSVDAILRAAALALAGTSESPRLDAELLLAHALGWRRETLFSHGGHAAPASALAFFHELLAARRVHRPMAQLLGRQEFWSLELRITRDVLVPRPETELLVESALGRCGREQAPAILDLGTGSGAVALALGHERPGAAVIATDCSEATLAVARDNATRLGLSRIAFRQGDWYGAVPDECFDFIVSNPPYIADEEWSRTSPELRFEPVGALRAGSDGLDALRVIVAGAPAHLRPNGWLMVEHGWQQAAAVTALMAGAGLDNIDTRRDLAGHARITTGQLAGRAAGVRVG